MRLRSAIFATLLAATAFSFGADPKVEDLLSHMRDAYKAVKTASFDVDAHLTIQGKEGDDAKEEVTAKVLYAGPNKVHLEMTPKDQPSDTALTLFYVQNGEKMALGPSTDKLRSRDYDEDQFPTIIPVNLETISFWQWDKQLNTAEGKNMHDSKLEIVNDVDWDGKKWTTLEETAEKDKVFVRYYIDPKTYMIWRCDVKNSETMQPIEDVWLTRLDLDGTIDDDQFKIPEGG